MLSSYYEYRVLTLAVDAQRDAEMKTLNASLKALQQRCKHPADQLDFQGDPAGGNDSYSECRLCGKHL